MEGTDNQRRVMNCLSKTVRMDFKDTMFETGLAILVFST